jgi:hypothetical protein
MLCKFCGSPYLERVRRHGILGSWFPSVLGFYPWRCMVCLHTGSYRARRLPDGRTSSVFD